MKAARYFSPRGTDNRTCDRTERKFSSHWLPGVGSVLVVAQDLAVLDIGEGIGDVVGVDCGDVRG